MEVVEEVEAVVEEAMVQVENTVPCLVEVVVEGVAVEEAMVLKGCMELDMEVGVVKEMGVAKEVVLENM